MDERKGNLCVLLASILFSIGGFIIKLVPWSGFSINGLRCMISATMILLFIFLSKRKLHFTKGSFLGAICVFAMTNLYSLANTMTTAANAILLQYVSPIIVILLMWFFFKEKPRRLDSIACIFVITGIVFFVMDSLSTGNFLGDALALLSAIPMAGLFMMGKIPGCDTLTSTFVGHTCACLVGLPFLLQETVFTPEVVGAAVAMGIFQTGGGFILLCVGLRYAKPMVAILLNGIEPVLNPVLAAIIVAERMSTNAMIGGAVVLITVMIYNVLSAKESEKERALSPKRE